MTLGHHNNNDFNRNIGSEEGKDLNFDALNQKGASNQENPFWYELRMTGKCPERRAYHTSFEHHNRLFVHGGYDITNGTLDSLYMLDVAKINNLDSQPSLDGNGAGNSATKKMLEWWRIETNGPAKPGPLTHHSSVVFGDKMYMFGGSGPRTQA